MTDEAIRKNTGRSGTEWFHLLEGEGMADLPHKQIAAHLAKRHGVSEWWSQTITVEYEKHIGRRILGQTESGGFQIGVTKTLPVDQATLWEYLDSRRGIALLVGSEIPDGGIPDGTIPDDLAGLTVGGGADISVKTTTYEAGSHVRIQWRQPEWHSYSILQIRVVPKGDAKTAITFHQEKLPDSASREAMKKRWKEAAHRIAGDLHER